METPEKRYNIKGIREFFEKDSVRGKVPVADFMAFWKSCTDAEKDEFSNAVTQMGYGTAVA